MKESLKTGGMEAHSVYVCVLIFETFVGGALWHNIYRGYNVFWGTIIYCSLAKACMPIV